MITSRSHGYQLMPLQVYGKYSTLEYVPTYPTFQNEITLWQDGYKYIVGIDEVGRGALAGPIVVGAVVLPKNFDETDEFRLLQKVRDSKTLSKKQKDELSPLIKTYARAHGVGAIEPTIIDTIGIRAATHQAGVLALAEISKKVTYDFILSDVALFMDTSELPTPCIESPNGDRDVFSIAAASIIAKVWRDQYMTKLGAKGMYSMFGWDRNAGYGTQEHRDAIKQFGLSDQHRLSFSIS